MFVKNGPIVFQERAKNCSCGVKRRHVTCDILIKGSGPCFSHKHQLGGSCEYMPHLPPSKKNNNEFPDEKIAFHPWLKK
jgi:hypothetical protein